MAQRTVILAKISSGIQIVGSPTPMSLGVPYSFTFKAAGGSGQYFWVETGTLPTGITFTDNGNGTATLAGTASTSGIYPFTVYVRNANGWATKQNYTLNVQPLTLNLISSGNVYRIPMTGQYMLAASGGAGGYTYSVTSGMPGGMSINSATGVFTGTPTTIGTFSVVCKVTDSAANNTTVTFTMIVSSRLTFSCPLFGGFPIVATTERGVFLSTNIYKYVSGYTGTLSNTGAIISQVGALNTSGTISGSVSVTSTGYKGFTTTFTDSGTGDTLTVSANVYAYAQNRLPSNGLMPPAYVGVPYSAQQGMVSPGIGPYTMSTSGTVPSWMTVTFDLVNGIAYFTGTPDETNVSYHVPYNFNIVGGDSIAGGIFGTIAGYVLNVAGTQPQQNGSNVGTTIAPTNWNYVGLTSVTNSSGTVTVTLGQATSVANGYLSSTDWTTFNNGIVTASAQSWSGDKTLSGKMIANFFKTNGNQSFPGAASSGVAYYYNDATLGCVIYGFGTTTDVDICNRNGTAAMSVTANDTTCNFPKQLNAVGGLGSTGFNIGTVTTSVAMNFQTDSYNKFTCTSATNIASSTATLPPLPGIVKIQIKTGATTSTIVWPATFKGFPTTGFGASKTSILLGFYDGTNVVLMSSALAAY